MASVQTDRLGFRGRTHGLRSMILRGDAGRLPGSAIYFVDGQGIERNGIPRGTPRYRATLCPARPADNWCNTRPCRGTDPALDPLADIRLLRVEARDGPWGLRV